MVTANGTLKLVPTPVLATPSFAPGPAILTGGTSPTITVTLPALSSAAASVSAVTFAVAVGAGAPLPQNKTNGGGGPVVVGDLGTPISFPAPSTANTDSVTVTYTLTIANGAGTTALATGTIAVVPAPNLGAATFTITPPSITGGQTPSLGTTLPSLTSPTSAGNSVTFAISNCGSGNVTKTNGGGGAIAIGDLGTAVTFASPSSASTDDKTCTYTLTVSNGAVASAASSASATGTLAITPGPGLSFPTLVPNPAIITGGTKPSISIPLPSGININSVTFTIADGSGAPLVQNRTSGGGGPVVVGDLGTTITVAAPTTLDTDTKTYTYKLTAFNGALPPASVFASGTLKVVPAPTLSAATFTIAPASITGGTMPSLGTTLPSLSSATFAGNWATFVISNCGSGNVNKTSGGGGAITISDLGTAVTFASPSSASTDNKTCTYTLKVNNGAVSSATSSASAAGTLSVIPQPAFSGALTATPNVILGGPNTPGLLQFVLPAISQGTATSVTLTATPAGGATTTVNRSGAGPIVLVDLGTTISVDSPSPSAANPTKVYTYALTATNPNGDKSAPTTFDVTSYPPSTNLANARIGATATLLPNGKVLIVGGGTAINSGVCSGGTNTAEVYDPATGSTVPAGTMLVSRCMHTAVLSPITNKVYVMGGANDARLDVFTYSASASPWGTWQGSGLPTMSKVRTGHSATLLGSASNGGTPTTDNRNKIAVVGGFDPSNGNAGRNDLELFDPGANSGNGGSTLYSFNPNAGPPQVTTTLSGARGEHAAVLIGPWLFFIGGSDKASAYSATIDVLDTRRRVDSGLLTTQIATSSPANAVARRGHSAIAVDSSTILVVGGYNGTAVLNSIQTYTVDSTTVGGTAGQVTGVSAITGTTILTTARVRFPLLAAGPANQYLVFGGTTSLGAPDVGTGSVEIIDSRALTASSGGTLKSVRQAATTTNLNLSGASNFGFLIAGGAAATGGAEFYIGP